VCAAASLIMHVPQSNISQDTVIVMFIKEHQVMTKTVKESRLESQSKLSNSTLSQEDLQK
jgi:hypothetical protein